MAVIAIDLGTTTCKAAICDGPATLSLARRHYSYSAPQPGWAEQDAESVWQLTKEVVGEALAALSPRPPVRALCVSVQGDAILPIDTAGSALHPAILGMDARSAREALDLEARFGRGWLYSKTGMPCEPLNAVTKIWWIVRHAPEAARKAWKFVHYGEYLLNKLAGVPALDFTMASRTMAFDPVRKDWVPEILDLAGLTPSQLGNVSAPGVPVGILRTALAEEWGIERDALVVTGGHDQCLAALGAGVIEPDLACYSMGTAEVIATCFAEPRLTAPMLAANYPCYCHAAPQQYFTITLNQSGGLSLDWFLGEVVGGDREREFGRGLAGLEAAPSAVLFLPHLVGSGTPACDHLSRGSFLGLSLASGRGQMFQAVVDALGYEARLNLETLARLGIPVSELRAVGGGARSAEILAIKASILNRPIRTLDNPEAALLGAAMLAQRAIGVFPDLAAARAECVRVARTIEPRAEAAERYDAAFESWRQIYGMLRDFYRHWSPACTRGANA